MTPTTTSTPAITAPTGRSRRRGNGTPDADRGMIRVGTTLLCDRHHQPELDDRRPITHRVLRPGRSGPAPVVVGDGGLPAETVGHTRCSSSTVPALHPGFAF